MDLKKKGSKKQGHCYSKREKAGLPLFFLDNSYPIFLNPAFFQAHILDLIFFKFQTLRKYQVDLIN